MRVELEGAEIYVRAGSTDMRKQINGLSVLVQEELKGDILRFIREFREKQL